MMIIDDFVYGGLMFGFTSGHCEVSLMIRVRRARQRLIFSERRAFDLAFQPQWPEWPISYPDALYLAVEDDFRRALEAANKAGGRSETVSRPDH